MQRTYAHGLFQGVYHAEIWRGREASKKNSPHLIRREAPSKTAKKNKKNAESSCLAVYEQRFAHFVGC
jgi:hypothetical protein